MIKYKGVIRASFCRAGRQGYIDVHLRGLEKTISLVDGIIAYCSKALSEKEIKTVIEILECKKELMLKERNFPPVYEEMLSDLIEVYKERYTKQVNKGNRRLSQDSLSITELEKVLERHYKVKEVCINSIYAGSNSYNTFKTEVGSPKGFLTLSFSRAEEDV